MNNVIIGSLKEAFQENAGSKFLFVEPGGNFGDHLIYWGAEHLARSVGVSFERMAKEEFVKYNPGSEEIIYIHGGGGYNPWCSGGVLQCLSHAIGSSSKLIIQGPCTVAHDSDYIINSILPVLSNNKDKIILFFAREHLSHGLFKEHLSSHCTDIMLDWDTALWLDKNEVINRAGFLKGTYNLYAFREDNEAGSRLFIPGQKGVKFDPAYFCKDFIHWVRVHIGAHKIITNRTHSSIIGTILEKETVLFPSRYHKNRSIWEYVLSQRGVRWSDGASLSGENKKNDYIDFLPPLLRHSYKVERCFRFFQGVPMS